MRLMHRRLIAGASAVQRGVVGAALQGRWLAAAGRCSEASPRSDVDKRARAPALAPDRTTVEELSQCQPVHRYAMFEICASTVAEPLSPARPVVDTGSAPRSRLHEAPVPIVSRSSVFYLWYSWCPNARPMARSRKLERQHAQRTTFSFRHPEPRL